MRTPIPPPRPFNREPPQLGAQRRVILSPLGLMTPGGARQPDHLACPALADAETVAKPSRPPGAGGPGLPISPGDLLQRLVLEHLVSDDPLELSVLPLELLEPLRILSFHPAVLVTPAVIGLLAASPIVACRSTFGATTGRR
jgi:hypothetical protein